MYSAESCLAAAKDKVGGAEVRVDTHAVQLAVWVPEKIVQYMVKNALFI